MTAPFEIEIYRTETGIEPFTEWESSLDNSVRVRIDARITRIRKTGNLGNCEPVGEGVFELKFDFGSGYRIYFGLKTNTFLILLLGGTKKGQQKDIQKAIEFWQEHQSQRKGKK